MCANCGRRVDGIWAEKTDDQNIRVCPDCKGELIDTGLTYAQYLDKWLEYQKEKDIDYDDYLRETIVIPYGKYDPTLKDKTKKNTGGSSYSGVKCPYCSSISVSKISSVSRIASVGFFGLASKKVGKQWHCNNCGSDF